MTTYRILDLDNCLSDDGWRVPKINWQKPHGNARYEEYHLLCGFDRPRNLDLTVFSGKLLILTGRPTLVRCITEEWLLRNNVTYAHLLMRNNQDQRPSVDVKQTQLYWLQVHYGIDAGQIVSAYDDHQEIVDMYRLRGIDAYRKFIHEHAGPSSAYINPNTKEMHP